MKGAHFTKWRKTKFAVVLRGLLAAVLVTTALLALGEAPPVAATQFYVRDNFGAVAYSNNDGSVNWAGNWIESGDDGNTTGGDIRILNSELRFGNTVHPDTNESIARAVDLSGVTGAILSFDARTSTTVTAGDVMRVEVSGNGGSSWAELADFEGLAGIVLNDQRVNRIYA
jgi:hypothetical protein